MAVCQGVFLLSSVALVSRLYSSGKLNVREQTRYPEFVNLKMDNQPRPAFLEATFSDSDSFAEATAGWDLEFYQLDRGPFEARLSVVPGKELVLQRVGFNRSIHQRGSMPDDAVTFGWADHSRMRTWYSRRDIPTSLLNFNSENGYESVTDAGFAGYTFAIARSAFDREATTGLETSSHPRLPAGPELFELRPQDGRRLSTLSQALVDAAASGLTGRFLDELQSDIVHFLARMSLHDPQTMGLRSSYSQRQRAVRRAVEFIQSADGQAKVGDVYRAAHVSWSTLDRAFREQFGLTPKQYIVALRLNRVRCRLVEGGSNHTVSEIALAEGFTHFGRFSADYKTMFGELPSATLQRVT